MDCVEKIRKALDIKRAACVKYSDENKEGIENHRVCDGLMAAADGKIIRLTAETCACDGGKSYLGLSDADVPLNLLVEGEKLWKNVTVAFRSIQNTRRVAKPPHGLAKNVYLYPPDREVFKPDLVIFIASSAQASRLVTLDQFWDGDFAPSYMNGSLCWSGITYPLMSGRINVTVGDPSARKLAGLRDGELIISVPFERIKGIAEAIDVSTAGTAEPSEAWKRAHKDQQNSACAEPGKDQHNPMCPEQ